MIYNLINTVIPQHKDATRLYANISAAINTLLMVFAAFVKKPVAKLRQAFPLRETSLQRGMTTANLFIH
jgi:hypothetical protein